MTSLTAVAIIEKDSHDNVLMSWKYPAIDTSESSVVVDRCGLLTGPNNHDEPFHFSKFKNLWQYYAQSSVQDNFNIQAVSIVILSEVFNPEKYQALLQQLLADYLAASCSPTAVLKSYLAAFTTGTLAAFDNTQFDDRKALVSSVSVFLERFGVETVVLWLSMLLKKRIFVYSESLTEVTAAVRAIPILGAWHRQNMAMLRPYVTDSETELKELEATGVYVAGFTDSNCQNHTQLFDVFVDLSARSYTIAEHAKGDFKLSKFHKDFSEELLAAAAENASDQAMIKLIANKTKELLGNLRSLSTTNEETGVTGISWEDLKSRKLPVNMDKFLYNVAIAENMVAKK